MARLFSHTKGKCYWRSIKEALKDKPIDVSEEPGMINTTHDNGRSLGQFIIGVSFFFAFQAITKSLKYVKFRLTTNQDLFPARSSVKFGESLASVLHLI